MNKQIPISLRQLVAASFAQWAVVEQARVRRVEAELAKLKAELQQALADEDAVIEKDTAALIEECRAYHQSKRTK